MRTRDRIRCALNAGVAAIMLTGCGSSAGSSIAPISHGLANMDLPAANQTRSESSSTSDSWTTFAYDYRRSGFNPAVKNLNRSTVSGLRLSWKKNVGVPIFASPVTYAGNLIVVSRGSKAGPPGSIVYDFRTSDGHMLWKFAMGSEAEMTPTIDPDAGLVIVANDQRRDRKTKPSYVFALRLLDGSLAWRQPLFAVLRAAPVVAGGYVYVGRAGGDPPGCRQGGITAFNESTGAVAWTWNVDPTPDEGGSVWGAIAYDGAHLVFGTGNTCQTPIPTANGAVSLNLDGTVAWNMIAVKDSHYDSDTGGGVMLINGRAHFINKNGFFYALDKETGNIVWRTDLNTYAQPHNWQGGFATPTTDGTTMVEGSGLYKGSKPYEGGEFCMLAVEKPTEVFPGFHSELQAMNLTGHVLWTDTMQNRLVGYVALANGLGFVGLNKDFVALDLSNGNTLWSYPAPAYIDASMVVVPSGVYAADDAGNVYAFTLASSARRR